MESVELAGIRIAIQRSAARKTLGITVERDGSVTARVPLLASKAEIGRALKSKELWLHSALQKQKEIRPKEGRRQYVTGEGFHYLGRSYRLRILKKSEFDDATPPLRFFQSRFLLRPDARAEAAVHFIRWYTNAGKGWLARHLPELSRRTGVAVSGTRISDLGYRWASCSKNGWLNFHWKTFLLPPPMVSYLIVHELCHLIEHNHSARFWRQLRAFAPDYELRERWLMEQAREYGL